MRSVKPTKLSRALGIALTPKAARQMERRPYPPGQHGKSKRPSKSDYAKQLLEKQKLKATYHITERQLKNYYAEASRGKTNSGTKLLQLLEARLASVVVRSGFAPTIYSARQLVSHGHITVNGRKVNVPSFSVKEGAVVGIAEKSKTHQLIVSTLQTAVRPPFINVDAEKFTATKMREPVRPEIPVLCDEASVIEYYSR